MLNAVPTPQSFDIDGRKMTHLLRQLPWIALMALAAPVLAQDSTEGAAEEITSETAQVGQVYVSEVFGDWSVQCERAPLGQDDPCEMSIFVNDQGARVAEFSVSRIDLPDDVVAVARIRTPLEVLLPPGVEIGVDGNQAGRVPYLACTPQFCVAEIQLRDKDVGVFKRGGEANLGIVSLGGAQAISLDISLTGFTAAFDSLSPIAAAAPVAE